MCLNLLRPSVLLKGRQAKIILDKKKDIIENFSYERRFYESIDYISVSWVISRISVKKEEFDP